MTFNPPRHSDAMCPAKPNDEAPHWAWPLAFAEHACCCAAKPVLLAVMPSTPARTYPVDLLLCDHHFLASRAALTAAGAVVYDENGTLIRTVVRTPPVVRAARRVDLTRHGSV